MSRKMLGVCLVVLLAVPVVSSAAAAPPFLLMWGSDGTEPGKFEPTFHRYLALDHHENIYVPARGLTPSPGNRVDIFRADGRLSRYFMAYGTSGALTGISVDSQGDIVVANSSCARVEKYDNQGSFLRMWGRGVQDGSSAFQICTSGCTCGNSGAGDGQLDNPWGLATDSDRNVYVAERANTRITKYDSLGNFLRTWGWGVQNGTAEFQVCTSGCQAGISGSGDGQFDLVTGVAVLGETVYVSEWANDRVELFSRDGAFQTKFAAGYSAAGVFVSPDGEIYVTRYWGDEVRKLDGSGTLVASWGASGSGIGEFDRPFGVAVSPSGNVYVLDQQNARIQKFGPTLRFFKAGLGDREKPLIAFPE